MDVEGEIHLMVGPRVSLAPATWKVVREVALWPESSEIETINVSIPAEAAVKAWKVRFPSSVQPVSEGKNCLVGNWKFAESPGVVVRTWRDGLILWPLVQTKAPLTETAVPPAVTVPVTAIGVFTRTGYGGKMAAESAELRAPALIRSFTSRTTVALSRPGKRLLARSCPTVRPFFWLKNTRSFLTESVLMPTGVDLPKKAVSPARSR